MLEHEKLLCLEVVPLLTHVILLPQFYGHDKYVWRFVLTSEGSKCINISFCLSVRWGIVGIISLNFCLTCWCSLYRACYQWLANLRSWIGLVTILYSSMFEQVRKNSLVYFVCILGSVHFFSLSESQRLLSFSGDYWRLAVSFWCFFFLIPMLWLDLDSLCTGSMLSLSLCGSSVTSG